MRLAIITDQHFGARNDSKYFLDNIEEFYTNIFFPTLEREKIDTVLMLGDTWENRKNLNVNTLYRARKMYFDRLEKMNVKVYVIYGNHDVFFKNTNEVNSIDILEKMYQNIRVIRTHEVIEFDGLPIAFISWVNNSNLLESLEFIKTAPAPILCGHFEIKTFEMIKGQVCDTGFDKSIFDRYDVVYSGHFHTMSDDGRIKYISNTNQTNWSDYGLQKGFRLFDTQTRELTFVENPYVVYGKIAYSDEFDVILYDYSHFKGKVVRVYVQSFSGCNQHKLNLFVERLQQFAHAVDVFEVDETTYNNDSEGSDSTDMKVIIDQYISDVVQNELIDKDKLKGIFMELYNEAVTVSGDDD